MVVSFSFWSITIVWKLNSGGCLYTSHRLTSCKPCAKSGRLTHCQQICQFEARAACCLESSVHSWRGQNGFTNGHNKDALWQERHERENISYLYLYIFLVILHFYWKKFASATTNAYTNSWLGIQIKTQGFADVPLKESSKASSQKF